MTADVLLVGLPEDSTPGVRIADVVIGERARKDYGDLASLMESIRDHGLLQPIGVLPGNRLLFGGRRLEACKRLGWESIPYTRPQTRDDALSLLLAERDENTCRKDMTPEELVDLGLKVEEIERPNAEARQARGIGPSGADARWHPEDASGSREPDASETHGRPSRTAIEVGAALDMGAATYKRAKHVVQVARGEIEAAPEVQAVAVEALSGMNSTGNITGAYQKVRKARVAAGKPAGKTEPAVSKPGRLSARHVIKVTSLRKITERISGYQEAITSESVIDPALTNEEATRLTGDLSKSIAALQRLNRLIKEHTQ